MRTRTKCWSESHVLVAITSAVTPPRRLSSSGESIRPVFLSAMALLNAAGAPTLNPSSS
jgi:hypothetical protein